MKKSLKYFALALCIIPCIMLFAACGSIVGKTYKYDNKVVLEFSNVTEEQKNAFFEAMKMTEEEFKQQYVEAFSVQSFEFKEDGSLVGYENGEIAGDAVYYVEDGNSLTVYEDEAHTKEVEGMMFKKEGSKVVMYVEGSVDNNDPDAILTIKIYFKKA